MATASWIWRWPTPVPATARCCTPTETATCRCRLPSSPSVLQFPSPFGSVFFFNDAATTDIYPLALHDALLIYFDSSDVSVLLGNGDGSFKAALTFGAGRGPSSVAVGDFNGDGKLDLAVANPGSSNSSVLHTNGDRHLQMSLAVVSFSTTVSVALRFCFFF